jgi:phosphopantetheinyl transferase
VTGTMSSLLDLPCSDRLWLVDRKASAMHLGALERQCPRLSSDDIARAEGLRSSSHDRAEIWRAGRIALRVILERTLVQGHHAARVVQLRGHPFELTAHGEPSLPGAPFVFSQSDAGPYLLIGVSSQGRIGVDLELPRTFVMSDARQARVIAVARTLAARDEDEPLSLLQAWTRIEAFAKARGPSLARVLTELGLIGVSTSSDVEARGSAVVSESGLSAHDLSLPLGLIGSVARLQALSVPPLTLFAG